MLDAAFGHSLPTLTGPVLMEPITRDTLIRDVLTSHGGAVAIFDRYGLGCAACMGADMETLASVATIHDIAIDDLLRDLNTPGTESIEVEQ